MTVELVGLHGFMDTCPWSFRKRWRMDFWPSKVNNIHTYGIFRLVNLSFMKEEINWLNCCFGSHLRYCITRWHNTLSQPTYLAKPESHNRGSLKPPDMYSRLEILPSDIGVRLCFVNLVFLSWPAQPPLGVDSSMKLLYLILIWNWSP